MVDALSRSMQVIHLESITSYQSDIKERVKGAQKTYVFFKTIKENIEKELIGMKYGGYQLLDDGFLTYKGRLYIQNCDELKRNIMDELHKKPYTGHPGYPKMIKTTQKLFYWPGMKKDIDDYLDKHLEC